MANVELRSIGKHYDGKVDVIKSIDLEIRDGEFMVFVGPSGCGKSTLLRMIAGLEDISRGELFIDEKLINDVAASKRGISMVFQNYALYPHMTVFENMAFGLRLSGVDKKSIEQVVTKAATVLKLDSLLTRYPKALSGGQRQRVAIGRAIVRKPGVFLFDEPLSNLDAALRVQMRIELAKLHKELKTTMIYVTHDQVEAMTLGDRIAVFNAGGIEQVGTPMDLYRNPKNRFVATFIGSPAMNIFEVNSQQLEIIKLIEKANISSPLKSEVFSVGVRSEHIKLRPPGITGIDCQLTLIEQLGDSIIAYVTSNSNNDVIAVKITGDQTEFKVGDNASLEFDVACCHFFDRNGESIK